MTRTWTCPEHGQYEQRIPRCTDCQLADPEPRCAEALREVRDESMGERYIQGIYRAALEQVRHCAACPGSMSCDEIRREIVGIVDSVIGPVSDE